MLRAVLVAVKELLAEVVVDGGIGAAPRRPGERDGRRDRPAAAYQQLGARADERRLGRSDGETEAGREQLAQGAVNGGRVVRRRRLDEDLTREHDLLKLAGRDPLHGALDRALELARRAEASHMCVCGEVRIEERKLRSAQRCEPLPNA